MDKATPFHHSHPQNPHPSKRNRANCIAPCVLDVAETYKSKPVSVFSTTSNEVRKLESLGLVKQKHTQMIKMEDKSISDALVVENLIKMYLKVGDFRSATTLFLLDFAQRSTSLSHLVEEFDKVGGRRAYEVLEVFAELHRKGLIFNSVPITAILRLCANLVDLWFGVEIHACLVKRGFESDVDLKCALMNFYANSWGLEYADRIFAETDYRTSRLRNEAIMVHLRSGSLAKALDLFREMQFSSMKANSYMVIKILQVCGTLEALEEGKQIHGYVIRSSLDSNLSTCNSLITMYTKCSKLEPARAVFHLMTKPNLISWNSIISGCSLNGHLDDAWQLFREMELSETKPDLVTWNCLMSGHFLNCSYERVLMILRKMQIAGLKPNSRTITSVLRAINELSFLDLGKEVHGYLIRNDFEYDIYVGTSLIDMYVKNCSLANARAVFDNLKNRNIVAWNTLISGYAFNGHFEETLKLLNRMEQEGIKPDLVTWNSLISGYSMHGRSKVALVLIRQMKAWGLNPNVVSWTALISGCSQRENYCESLELFIQMQREGIKPNSVTISSVLRACAGLSLLQKGKEIHCVAVRNKCNEDIFVATSLIDMYSKSGSLKNSYRVFKEVQNKTLALWNSIIMGFSIHGIGKEAILLFKEMCENGVNPDGITLTAVLSACRHSGLVDEGWKYFDSMKTYYEITPTLEHYSCMVDLLGRGGYLDEALDIIQTMPLEPDASIWGSLLASCRIHKNLDLAEIAAEYLFKLEPHNSANYIMMMSLYANANRWEDVDSLRDSMDAVGVRSRPGWSWIQIDHTIHVFSVKGETHPDIGEIYFELYQLVSEMKKLGYVPDLSCVFENIDKDEKEKVLMNHTEKLAVTYGLIKSGNTGPIRVAKNTRICADCHRAVKYMSQITGREIILRDAVRFHHFQNGNCSCNNYW
ncbi:hypothetical protein GIB67_006381 [Kingdonia uniflora]|uniref:DYW domain-containing protein n=1 Tax=Kingdonia uniflora TaxID=39325 RepID=A0A7J7P0P3_9MAGN|nr:hypothetical protein GIB67_006381 [Kingdonia uniflora]